jgi:hypothetical protein
VTQPPGLRHVWSRAPVGVYHELLRLSPSALALWLRDYFVMSISPSPYFPMRRPSPYRSCQRGQQAVALSEAAWRAAQGAWTY